MSYVDSFPQDCPKRDSSLSPDGVFNGDSSGKSGRMRHSRLWTNVEDTTLLETFIKCKSVLESPLFWKKVAKKMNTERSAAGCRNRFYALMDSLPLPIRHSFVTTKCSEIATVSTPEAVETALELSSFFTHGGTIPKIISELLIFRSYNYTPWTDADEDKLLKAVKKYDNLGKVPHWRAIAKELGHKKSGCQSKFYQLKREGKLYE